MQLALILTVPSVSLIPSISNSQISIYGVGGKVGIFRGGLVGGLVGGEVGGSVGGEVGGEVGGPVGGEVGGPVGGESGGPVGGGIGDPIGILPGAVAGTKTGAATGCAVASCDPARRLTNRDLREKIIAFVASGYLTINMHANNTA